MDDLEQVKHILSGMKRSEKAQILQWVAREIGGVYPGIESTPGVCGGEPCIVRTRIPVWMLVQAHKLGISEAEILHSYPALRAEDLVNAWSYYQAHHTEIDTQISENEIA